MARSFLLCAPTNPIHLSLIFLTLQRFKTVCERHSLSNTSRPSAWPSGLLIHFGITALQVELEITLRGPKSPTFSRATMLVTTSLLPPTLLQTQKASTLRVALHVAVPLFLLVVFDLSN